MPRRSLALIVAASCCGAWAAAGGEARADERGKRWRATRTADAPEIDGRLDDAAWRAAAVDDRFGQTIPDEGTPPTERTELRVLYDDDNLYFAIRCFDSQPRQIVERLSRRDRETDADRVAVDISSRSDGHTAYHFDVNVAGVLSDGLRFDDAEYTGEWDGFWRAATARDERGWTAELAIPLTTLRYERGRRSFGFQVRRSLQRRQELDEWAHVPRTSGAEVSYYGTLELPDSPRPRRLVQVAPYLAAKAILRRQQSIVDGVDGWTRAVEVGGDVKLGLTPALTLDLTVNPDFGEVEVDELVLNLTTFETFYPEKRPFFLEALDLFAMPIGLFYSRRIGRASLPPDDVTLAAPLQDGRIWAAAKLTGAIAPRLDIALLDALVAADEALIVRDGRRQTLALRPLTNFGVVRLKRDLFARSSISLMATAVNPLERSAAARETYAASADVNLVTRDGGWVARAQVVGSLVHDGAERITRDGTVVGPGARGVGMFAQLGKHGGRWWGDLEYQGYSPAFDVDEVGYNRQANLHWMRPQLHYRIVQPVGRILDGELRLGGYYLLSWDGRATLQRQAFAVVDLRFANFWSLSLEVDWDSVHDDLRETGDGARTERAGGFGGWLALRTDVRARAVLTLESGAIQTRHGLFLEGKLTLSLRPVPAVEIDVAPHAVYAWGDPRWFATTSDAPGAHTYYFGDETANSVDVTLRATYTFTPTLSLQLYAQLFLSSLQYENTVAADVTGERQALPWSAFHAAERPAGETPDFRDGGLNVNAVLRWELHPGTTLMVIYTHAQQPRPYSGDEGRARLRIDTLATGPTTDLFLIKARFMLQ